MKTSARKFFALAVGAVLASVQPGARVAEAAIIKGVARSATIAAVGNGVRSQAIFANLHVTVECVQARLSESEADSSRRTLL